MNIGFATSTEKKDLTSDDQRLARELTERGAKILPFVWNQTEIAAAGFDAVVIRSIWDYYQYPGVFAGWLRTLERSEIPVINDVSVLRMNSDKTYLLDLGEEAVPSLQIESAAPAAKAAARVRAAGWKEIVVKPTISANGFLTKRFRSDAISDGELAAICGEICAHSALLAQPFLPSVETDGEVSLIYFRDREARYSHAIQKKARSGEFRVQSEFGGVEIAFAPPPDLRAFAERVLAKVAGDWTYARVDILDWKTTPRIGELEMIEPDLFLRHREGAIADFADLLLKKLNSQN